MVLVELWPFVEPRSLLFSCMDALKSGVVLSLPPPPHTRYPGHSTSAAALGGGEEQKQALETHHVPPLKPQCPPVEWEVVLPVKHGGSPVLSDGFW